MKKDASWKAFPKAVEQTRKIPVYQRKMMTIRLPSLFLLCFSIVLLQQCAVRRAPEGGPPDKAPPEVVYTFPGIDSTNVGSINRLEVRFSENLDRASLRNQVWMLPDPPGGFEIKWQNSKHLHIVVKDSLEANRTYLLTIGTAVKDQRGNKLPEPVLLPFSTGPVIDRAEIAGKLYATKPEDTFIYAYNLDEDYTDSTIFKRKPRYFTQVSKDGAYRMGYLKPGHYRVFALSDQNRDRLYSKGTDLIGIPARDVQLDSLHLQVQGVDLVLQAEDEQPPVFLRARSVHQSLFVLELNEPLAQPDTAFTISLRDSISNQSLAVLGTERDPADLSRLLIYTAEHPKAVYLGQATTLADTSGNVLQQLTFRFESREKIDTVKARLIKMEPRDNQTDVPAGAGILLELSQPAGHEALMVAVTVQDSLGTVLTGKWQQAGSRRPAFIPEPPFARDMRYRLQLDLAKLQTLWGDTLGDSLLVHQFSSWKYADLGGIAGVAELPATDAQVILDIRAMQGKKRYSHVAAVGKPFVVENIPEGPYRLRALLDVNRDGRWSKGASLPFEFAEPFVLYPDTVKVRKRWTTEGIVLKP